MSLERAATAPHRSPTELWVRLQPDVIDEGFSFPAFSCANALRVPRFE
jgi:hypothetical protein